MTAATAKTAILLVNLGSPDEPTPAAVRRYLAEFLWDPRVVELPRLPWWLILHGIILNTRPAKSAEKYAQIWTPEGSPLKVHTEKQAKLLRGLLGMRGQREIIIAWAMRYGQPALDGVLDHLAAQGCQRILVVPLYPQYANSTTASVMDAVAAWQRRNDGVDVRSVCNIRNVRSFATDPGYIAALAASVRKHWQTQNRALAEDRLLLMSFHGIPKRSVERGDPYQRECEATAHQLATALNLKEDQWLHTFQSRFGRAEWLQPYTQQTLEKLAADGVRRVDVICPGFVADCLETLEEIALENKAAFLAAGGREFHYIPCLNENPDWIEALADLSLQQLGDWLPAPIA
ncbi:Ferrochelatase [Sterolibacterium denitrificans]|uniref:Ferrochelatase n=1 Tax=Sterolibacterium denitrificans TaxID=157592 RepID=A0A7Z7HQD2_9PROT|nr:ferrochelatase [Sterolibacterium denitrificans]SMB24859.1 Ferrochelatase [Sterolibacterium denitrificans]